jgi:benzylsuccinate CoA-transferase BbsF subunit
MERLGMDYETVQRIKPDVIYLSMPMYGENGPRSELLGVGMTISAVTGLMWSTGYRADDPVGPGTHYPDHAANPYHAAFAVLAALRRRRITGEGMKIDLSQVESTINFIGSAMVRCAAEGADRPQVGNASRTMAPQGFYRCAGDDAWCAITAETDGHWRALAAILGGEALADRLDTVEARLAARGEIDAIIGGWTADRSADSVAATLSKAGIPAAMVANARHLIEFDRQLADRAYWQRVEHPELGNSLYASPPYRIDGQRVELARPPLLGEHTREVLGDLLGMREAELDSLESAGVFK